MVAHVALYREWRPQTFADVVSQAHITRTLRHAVAQGRLAHAYLFSGPRGTGKTSVARLLAKAANCLRSEQGEPCNTCSACESVITGRALDVIEIDAASNRGIDEVRDLRDKVRFSPAELKYKVYIVDEVHMLTEPAFNALLKTLEEPPRHAIFILATTEPHKVPVTILSRCQRYEFHRLTRSEITSRLTEVCDRQGVKAEPEALAAMARQAEGGLRDALSLLDQVLTFVEGGAGVTLAETLAVLGMATTEQLAALAQGLLAGDAHAVLLQVDQAVRDGKDLRQFLHDFLGYLRDLLLVMVGATAALADVAESTLVQLQAIASQARQETVMQLVSRLAELEGELRHSASPRLLVEVALIRLSVGASASDRTAIAGAQLPSPAPAAFDVPRPVPTNVDRLSRQPGETQAGAESAAAAVAGGTPAAEGVAGGQSAPSDAQLAAITELWPRILELFGGKKHLKPFQALLREGKPYRISGQTLVIGFPVSYPVHREKVASRRDWVEKALEHLGYPGLRVEAELVEALPATPAGGPDWVALMRQRLGDIPVIEVKEEELP